MSQMSLELGKQTVIQDARSAITLEFAWGTSCCKGKYPRWRQPPVTDLLHENGLTDEMLAHELKLIADQVDTIYGSCVKCLVTLYVGLLLFGVAAIGVQFVLAEYRRNVLDIVRQGAWPSWQLDFVFEFVLIMGGLVAVACALALMCVHRKCLAARKYKQSMRRLKEYVVSYDLQNKYTLVKWHVNPIVTPRRTAWRWTRRATSSRRRSSSQAWAHTLFWELLAPFVYLTLLSTHPCTSLHKSIWKASFRIARSPPYIA